MANDGPAIEWATPDSGSLRAVWYICIILAFISFFMGLKEYVLHKRFENHPKVQHYMERLLWTMPVYAVCGVGTILFPLCAVQFILLRQSMQAFMVYNFVQLLITYFTPYATEEVRIKHLEALLSKVDKVLIPVRVFLYAIPLFAVLGLLSDSYNYYGFGILDISHTWFWLNLASVLVTMWALSALFTIFQLLEPLLLPFVKLQNTCVHIVLGPMVFQELIIGILAENGKLGLLFGLKSEAESALVLVNLLYCIEGVVVGYLFLRAFSAKQFYEEEVQDKKWTQSHDIVDSVHGGRTGKFFRGTHRKPRFSIMATPRRRDAGHVAFTNAEVMKDISTRDRRESTVNDHSRFSVRAHETESKPMPSAV